MDVDVPLLRVMEGGMRDVRRERSVVMMVVFLVERECVDVVQECLQVHPRSLTP